MDRRRSLLKIAALRTEREHQQGAYTAKGGFTSAAPELRKPPFTVQCVFVPRSLAARQTPFTMGGGSNVPRIDILPEGKMSVYFGSSSNSIPVVVGDVYDIVFVCEQERQSAYFNGELIATREAAFPEVVSYYNIGFYVASVLQHFDGDYLLHRHFDYAFSADEAKAIDNNGDPMGYVLPVPYKFKVADYISDFSKNADGWFAPPDSPGTSINTGEGVLSVSGDSTVLRIQHNGMASGDKPGIFRVRIAFAAPFTGSMVQVFAHSSLDYAYLTLSVDKLKAEGIVHLEKSLTTRGNAYIYLLDVPIGDVVKISTITIESVGCVAEYLPQNILVSRKRDFPHVSFPGAGYNPASGVFIGNSQSTTRDQYNIPQANGFSGNYMRFDAITVVSLYCAYWYYYTRASVPIKVTFEYRSNTTIYSSQTSINPSAADSKIIGEPNEGNPKIISVTYGLGAAAYLFSKPNLPDAWLEMRVLSIEILEGICLKWYDSAKQLPLNDEYLPPLLESDGGYDLTAVGTPEIIIE